MLGQHHRRLPSIEPALSRILLSHHNGKIPANTRRLTNVDLMLAQRQKRCANGKSTLVQRLLGSHFWPTIQPALGRHFHLFWVLHHASIPRPSSITQMSSKHLSILYIRAFNNRIQESASFDSAFIHLEDASGYGSQKGVCFHDQSIIYEKRSIFQYLMTFAFYLFMFYTKNIIHCTVITANCQHVLCTTFHLFTIWVYVLYSVWICDYFSVWFDLFPIVFLMHNNNNNNNITKMLPNECSS